MRLILGIMLAGWMIIIFWFSNQPATESSEISGTISYRLVEDTDEIFNWGLTRLEILQETLSIPSGKLHI